MFLVFLGGRLSWITNAFHLCAPVIESGLSILHVLVVCLTVQLTVILFTFRTQRTVVHEVAFTVLIMWLVVLRFLLAWTCLPRSFLLLSKIGLLQSNVTCFLFFLFRLQLD